MNVCGARLRLARGCALVMSASDIYVAEMYGEAANCHEHGM